MRYTHKLDKPDGRCNYFLTPDKEECDNAENKLGQLEDIEEQLGIDLVTLFKALSDGFYFIDERGVFHNTRCYLKPVLDAYRNKIEIQEYVDNAGGYWFKNTGEYVRLSDYGKTWALTKEELE